ncbi:MAG: AAA family ATPase [Chloroflexota bacterium]
MAEIEAELHRRINSQMKRFRRHYKAFLDDDIEIDPIDSLTTLDSLLDVVVASGYKLYLFIDEYDNFANEVMMNVQQRSHRDYESLVTGEGMFKTFFKNIKSVGGGDGLDRVFITGVTPIVMNDVTSGANVFDDIYWFDWFNDLCGFWEHEVADMLSGVLDERGISPKQHAAKHAEALDMMRTHYDGSWFTPEIEPPAKLASTDSRLYNPTMVFYFLRYLQRTGAYPEEMLDRNLKADRGKLKYIASYSSGREVLVKALNTEQEVGVHRIGTEFGADELLQDDMRQGRLASLLCYLGALTLNGKVLGQIRLIIPNLVMAETYAERILAMTFAHTKILEQAAQAAEALFLQGDIEPVCDFIEANHMAVYSNRDYPEFKELTLKSIFVAMLYHHPDYIMHSEPELNRRYGDLVMLLRPNVQTSGLFNLLFEFKQLALNKIVEADVEGDEETDEKKYEKKKRVNKAPLKGSEVKEKSRDELLEIPAVHNAITEAETQLQHYQRVLRDQYGSDLNLSSFAVVGVGVERVAWKKLKVKS